MKPQNERAVSISFPLSLPGPVSALSISLQVSVIFLCKPLGAYSPIGSACRQLWKTPALHPDLEDLWCLLWFASSVSDSGRESDPNLIFYSQGFAASGLLMGEAASSRRGTWFSGCDGQYWFGTGCDGFWWRKLEQIDFTLVFGD